MIRMAAWLWLPLFIALCFAIGTYRTAAGAAESGPGSCGSSATQLDIFLGCP